MNPLYSPFHSHTRSRNSRPSSGARCPALEVALDEHLRRDTRVVGARKPQRRPAAHPVEARHDVLGVTIAWPMCSLPVTLGGGIGITKHCLVSSPAGWKYPDSSHHLYSRSSTSLDAYCAAISSPAAAAPGTRPAACAGRRAAPRGRRAVGDHQPADASSGRTSLACAWRQRRQTHSSSHAAAATASHDARERRGAARCSRTAREQRRLRRRERAATLGTEERKRASPDGQDPEIAEAARGGDASRVRM